MKRIFLAILMLFSIVQLQAQPYSFTQYTSPYTPLSNGTSINNGNTWSGFQTFNVPIGFSFEFVGANFTTVDFEASGRLIFDPAHLHFADMFTVAGMQDKGTSASLSPLSYELAGSAGSQICKIEVSNATYQNDPAATVNYQIWLYEGSNILEMHMGPNSVTSPATAFPSGAFSGVFHVTTFTPLTYDYGLALHGNPSAPSDSTFSGTGINSFGIVLNDIPVETTVYQFVPTASNTSDIDSENKEVLLYPNPAKDELFLDFGSENLGQVTYHLKDIKGQLMKQESVLNSGEKVKVDLTAIPQGIYLLSIENGVGDMIHKRVVKL
jgi:hypothetical protein